MEKTRKHFTQDYLVSEIRNSFAVGLRRYGEKEIEGEFTNLDCLMAGLGVFSFKYQSLLQFDKDRQRNEIQINNLKKLYQIKNVPCDTQMRVRLDMINYNVCRLAFTRIFTLIQRAKILEHFLFLEKYYLISIDGTGVFSSDSVHCKNCCVKNHKDNNKTYYHQILTAALVSPSQSVVFPFAPEPIMKSDGDKKNDCERNSAKRWLQDFRREHPHLQVVVVLDGLSANAPFIKELKKYNLRYIIVCQEADHKYLTDWVHNADIEDSPRFTETIKEVTHSYRYMNNVPLNETNDNIKVNVIRFTETKKGKSSKWMWVTDLAVSNKNIREIVKGGRSRWRIENETFNTLKNQGYNFEHNYGHGKNLLCTVFSYLMLLAFFVDQCLQQVNKRFQEAYAKYGSKRTLWQKMRSFMDLAIVPSFESIYESIARPPPPMLLNDAA